VNAEIMFVGEGPGADEDKQGEPFVGRAGQLLNNMITAMGFAARRLHRQRWSSVARPRTARQKR